MLLALLLSLAEPPIPKGPNDATIGKAEDFRVDGPAKLCFKYGSVALNKGETAYLLYLGIHSVSVRIDGTHGSTKVSEGNTWANIDEFDETFVRNSNSVKRLRTRYAIFGRPEYSPDRDALMFWVDGLWPYDKDLRLLDRIHTKIDQDERCTRRFVYGEFFEE